MVFQANRAVAVLLTASISKGVSGWSITLTDSSNGNSFTTTGLAYAGPGTSAEWIVEAPTVGGRLATLARYAWHVVWMLRGRGAAARFRREGNSALRMVLYVFEAHWQMLRHGRLLWRKRRAIRRSAKLSTAQFRRLLRAHSIGPRQVAEL